MVTKTLKIVKKRLTFSHLPYFVFKKTGLLYRTIFCMIKGDIMSSKQKEPHTGNVTHPPDSALFYVSKIRHSFIIPSACLHQIFTVTVSVRVDKATLTFCSPVSGIMPELVDILKGVMQGSLMSDIWIFHTERKDTFH